MRSKWLLSAAMCLIAGSGVLQGQTRSQVPTLTSADSKPAKMVSFHAKWDQSSSFSVTQETFTDGRRAAVPPGAAFIVPKGYKFILTDICVILSRTSTGSEGWFDYYINAYDMPLGKLQEIYYSPKNIVHPQARKGRHTEHFSTGICIASENSISISPGGSSIEQGLITDYWMHGYFISE